MATGRKAQLGLRIASGVIALMVLCAIVMHAADGELETWRGAGTMLAALFGAYLFAYFAVRGRFFWWPEDNRNRPSDSTRDEREAQ